MSAMPPGHERWDSFESLVASCSWSRGRALRALRDQMVAVQVARYLAFVGALWSSLLANMAMSFGLNVDCGWFALICTPWLAAFAAAGLTVRMYASKEYMRMCESIESDPGLLDLIQKATDDDYVLKPALEILLCKLVQYRLEVPRGA